MRTSIRQKGRQLRCCCLRQLLWQWSRCMIAVLGLRTRCFLTSSSDSMGYLKMESSLAHAPVSAWDFLFPNASLQPTAGLLRSKAHEGKGARSQSCCHDAPPHQQSRPTIPRVQEMRRYCSKLLNGLFREHTQSFEVGSSCSLAYNARSCHEVQRSRFHTRPSAT